MANPFSKGWKYLMQSFDSKIEEHADPKVQVQQAVAEAKRRHQEISNHAASIIGNRNQLQMKLERLLKSQDDLQTKARTALQAADQAQAKGEAEKAQQFNSTAEVIASQLVSVEQEIEATTTSLATAEQAAAEAQKQQKLSESNLQQQLNDVSQLERQIDQATMQERTAQTMDTINQFGGNDNVPTLDGVREKIERRYASALGAQELAQNSVTDRMVEIESAGGDVAASNRLAEIRASMGAGELEAGTETTAEETAVEANPQADTVAEAEAYIEDEKNEETEK
ncbi:PspA/IM30 family protein [Corynebacterium sp.]|uniref:PspA/IM30 family protein n=1 Tax=Corynebacterium sp. TaxID=1720 RepID=UPI002A911D32|nr:PspA/IM30 family protein [Corynebacterium sp.]MDY5785453.1 PspA/IM30 family protein [Corynebacterium sp.]